MNTYRVRVLIDRSNKPILEYNMNEHMISWTLKSIFLIAPIFLVAPTILIMSLVSRQVSDSILIGASLGILEMVVLIIVGLIIIAFKSNQFQKRLVNGTLELIKTPEKNLSGTIITDNKDIIKLNIKEFMSNEYGKYNWSGDTEELTLLNKSSNITINGIYTKCGLAIYSCDFNLFDKLKSYHFKITRSAKTKRTDYDWNDNY